MDISETPPFTELVELDFDWRVNLFIGPNASGKSVLLKEIDAALLNEDRRPSSSQMWKSRSAFVLKGVSREGYGGHISSTRGNLLFTSGDRPVTLGTSNNPRTPPVISIGPVRTGLPELHGDQSPDECGTDVSEVLSRPFSGSSFKIVNEQMHQKAVSMFEQQDKEDTPPGEGRAHQIFKANEIVYSCVKSICEEVVTGTITRNYVTGLNEEDLDHQPLANFDEVTVHRSLGINTIDQPNFINVRPEDRPTYSEEMGQAPLYAGFLSSGTQTTFLWIYWLAYKMLHHYEFADGWMDKPAILLIDEIENHLHPTWQRRVIPALLENFKGLQIFATTHSPFVVAGLRAGQVHLLDRNSEGVVTASTNERDIIGWTTDEILRTFMGVDEPTDERTIRHSKRLRELRGKESLSDDEREELDNLRQQVNEDLLSSTSPLEAQRERYADMMVQFLQSRQSELSQDGG